jgi:hypothetical protein
VRWFARTVVVTAAAAAADDQEDRLQAVQQLLHGGQEGSHSGTGTPDAHRLC